MNYIDMHCDTIMSIPDDGDGSTLYSNPEVSVDFVRMKESKAMAQFFAIFLFSDDIFKSLGKKIISDDAYIERAVGHLKSAVKANNEIIEMAYNYNDLVKNHSSGKMSAFLTIEDGRSASSFDKIKNYYQLGIRLIGLTWNYENCMGYPNSDDEIIMSKGLKQYGREAVECMNELGIIVDVSHLSDGGFYDVAKVSSKPFVASHSNCRSISPHKRNLTDDMIKVLGESGGVAGLNFAPQFLSRDISNENSRIDMMVEHLNHLVNIGGRDIVALGSDFDGISGNLEIDGSDKMPLLFEALRKDGWKEDLIEKLAYKNVRRVLKDTLK